MSLVILCMKCPFVLLLTFLTVLSVFLIWHWEDNNDRSTRIKQVQKNVTKTFKSGNVIETHQRLKDDNNDTARIPDLSNTIENIIEERSILFETKKADKNINEKLTVTEKAKNLFEARKAYFGIHGRSISETKCLEYTRHHYSLLERRNKTELYNETLGDRNASRIIGSGDGISGRDVSPAEFPHMGALGWLDKTFNWVYNCGCSLISPNFVLTAAHCSWVPPRHFNLIDPKPKIVRLGTKNILEDRALHYFDIEILQIIVHPKYKSPIKYHDIALVQLKIKVPFYLYLAPACLWRDPYVAPGTAVFGTGWGYTNLARKSMSSELQAVEIEIIDSNLCNRIFNAMWNRNFHGLRSHQICAGKMKGGVDTCQGDSGGPIQKKLPCTPLSEAQCLSIVIGVTSFGFGCARPGVPSVYTRVSSYIDWIEDNVWEKELELYQKY